MKKMETITMNIIEPDESWAVTEFADAQLHDIRRTQRLVSIATVLAQQPQASFPEACGSPSMLKGTYRFFDNDAIEAEAILESHVSATSLRITALPRGKAVQDTTELDWSHHPATTELGPLSGATQQGMFAHTTLAITPERVPVGIIAQSVWGRDPTEVGKRATRKVRPITQKESQKWMKSLSAVIEFSHAHPDTHFVSIGDREADVYDLFLLERPSNVDWLALAAFYRRVEGSEKYLWSAVETQPIAATVTLEIPRHGEHPARQATLTVRFGQLTLQPPRYRTREHLPPISVWTVYARDLLLTVLTLLSGCC
jgi:hypothetical protein